MTLLLNENDRYKKVTQRFRSGPEDRSGRGVEMSFVWYFLCTAFLEQKS